MAGMEGVLPALANNPFGRELRVLYPRQNEMGGNSNLLGGEGTGGGSAFNFPFDKFPSSSQSSNTSSWSGLKGPMQGAVNSLAPLLQSTMSEFPAQKQAFYDQSRADVTSGYDDAQGYLSSMFGRQIGPALQQALNSLSQRNMINSSVGGNTMATTARGVGQDIMNKTAQMSLAKQMALANIAQQQGSEMHQFPQILAQLAGLGRQTGSTSTSQQQDSDPSVPYRAALGFLGSLMA